jgi:glycosyltransferase involved in cell wall biosynthesis
VTKPFVPEPELRLLLAAARAVVSPGTVEPLRLASPTDWTALTRMALHHGVTPLLADALESVSDEPVPREIREALRLHLEANREAALRQVAELGRLLPALAEWDVPALAVGGPVLAHRAYGRVELRRAGSLDLLIRPEHRIPVREMLQRDGYVRVEAHPAFGPDGGERFRRQRDGLVVDAGGPAAFGMPSPRLATSGIWQRAESVSIGGREIRSAEVGDLLWIACVRATARQWGELRFACEVAGLLARHPDLDLADVLERARRHGGHRMVLVGIHLACVLVSLRIADPIRSALASDDTARTLSRELSAELLNPSGSPSSSSARHLFQLRMRERLRDRASHAANVAASFRLRPVRAPTFLRRRPRRPSGARDEILLVDWVPQVHEGAGFPRMSAMLRLLVDGDRRITLHPVVPVSESGARLEADLQESIEVVADRGLADVGAYLGEQRERFSTLIASRPPVMRALVDLFERQPELRGNLRVVYDAEAIFALREIRRRRLRGKSLGQRVATQLLAEEVALAAHADAVLAVSELEARILRTRAGVPVHVLPQAISPTPTTRPFAERRGLLFVGRLAEDGWPNSDSILWFCEEILPEVRRRLAGTGHEVTLTVAGKTGAREIEQVRGPGVRILGVVDDLATLHDEARIFVAPTRFAAGVPNKVIEAAAHGLPVVATRLLARQLGWRTGVELLAAPESDAASFVTHVVDLYTREDVWQRLRANALARVEAECAPARARETLAAAIDGP